MIKSIAITRYVDRAGEFERLASFLEALGLERGTSSAEFNGQVCAFVAPAGALELISATGNAERDCGDEIHIEVTHLDSMRQAAEEWVKRHGERTEAVLGEMEQDTANRRFTATPTPSCSVTFWELDNPLEGKPLAMEGDLSAETMRFAIVVARWNAVITERLLHGALDALYRSGARKADVQIVRVPGAWEIPSAASKLARSGNYDAIITLGLLLRGETAHYEAIYTEVSRGIGQSQLDSGIPHAFGVLTCENLGQALDRAGLKSGNKGFESACAAIEMVSLHRRIGAPVMESYTRV